MNLTNRLASGMGLFEGDIILPPTVVPKLSFWEKLSFIKPFSVIRNSPEIFYTYGILIFVWLIVIPLVIIWIRSRQKSSYKLLFLMTTLIWVSYVYMFYKLSRVVINTFGYM